MLRRKNKDKTYTFKMKIAGEESSFVLRSMSLDDTNDLLDGVTNLSDMSEDGLGRILDIVAAPIISIDGLDESPRTILGDLEFNEDLNEVIQGIVDYTTMTREEVENLDCSSGQATAGSAECAAKAVEESPTEKQESVPASAIQIQTER